MYALQDQDIADPCSTQTKNINVPIVEDLIQSLNTRRTMLERQNR